MLGAMIGDICGSIYEGSNYKGILDSLIHPRCHYTDDSVMTSAVTSGLLKLEGMLYDCNCQGLLLKERVQDVVRDEMILYTRKYPWAGYGSSFVKWIYSSEHLPYNSWGNGAAMRTSSCGWYSKNIEEARKYAEWVACITHNHPEGVKGAVTISECIFLLRHGGGKNEVLSILQDRYAMNYSLDQIRPVYGFDVSASGTVPYAIKAFLEGENFEEVIKLAISIGGDSDTIAAIAGSLAECFYAIPDNLVQFAIKILPNDIIEPVLKAEEIWGLDRNSYIEENTPK